MDIIIKVRQQDIKEGTGRNCRGLGVVLNKWHKPCSRLHFVEGFTALGEGGNE